MAQIRLSFPTFLGYLELGLSFALFLALFLVAAQATRAETPDQVPIKAYVNDYAGLLTPEEENALSLHLASLESKGIAQVAIVTVNSLNGQDIESFSLQLAQGVLGDKEKDNGLLFLISVEDRKYRFEVGRGLEAELNDAKVGRIARTYVVPAFQAGNYSEGIFNAVSAIGAVLSNDTSHPVMQPVEPPDGFKRVKSWVAVFIELANFIIFFIATLLFVSLSARARSRGKGRKEVEKKSDKYFLAAMLLSSMMGRRGPGGGFGGDGFSGGGGSFGGGGASGGW